MAEERSYAHRSRIQKLGVKEGQRVEAGLVDVKVVRYSDTHTAEKFVIPVSRRG